MKMQNDKAKFLFGDIVVVENYFIGVVVKTWQGLNNGKYRYDVYVRSYNAIVEFDEKDIERYRVRHKELSEEEKDWQNE
jgi:hypothetical protein